MKTIPLTLILLFSILGQIQASAEFSQGSTDGLEWEARFNLPDCFHAGHRPYAWCLSKDAEAAAEKSGVENKLKSWINNPKVKSLYLAYLSFSNKPIRAALCDAALKSNKLVHIFLDSGYKNDQKKLAEHPFKKTSCGPNFNLHFRGIPFGTPGGHLQHMKIFMALEDKDLDTAFNNVPENKTIRFTSSSANLSNYGTNIHFENWLFFKDKSRRYLPQQNLCIFKAMTSKNTQAAFSASYHQCVKGIQSTPRKSIKLFVVPNTIKPIALREKQNPYIGAMMPMVQSAQKYIKVAIHRLTSWPIYDFLFARSSNRVSTFVIYDDDTYRTNVGAGTRADVGKYDVYSYRDLKKSRTNISFIETNHQTRHLQHNKFIVVDGTKLFQGAGNFTSSALNISPKKVKNTKKKGTYITKKNQDGTESTYMVKTSKGNYEQFYYITDLQIVAAYDQAWDELLRRSSLTNYLPDFSPYDPPIKDLEFK